MAKIDIKFAELHGPLFLGGKNFNTKLDPGHFAGLKLVYDRQEKELHVFWEQSVGIIPASNIVCMVEGVHAQKAPAHVHPIVAAQQITAQVSGPQSHVHAGLGHGKTGQEK